MKALAPGDLQMLKEACPRLTDLELNVANAVCMTVQYLAFTF
jgi:hypothetical protein